MAKGQFVTITANTTDGRGNPYREGKEYFVGDRLAEVLVDRKAAITDFEITANKLKRHGAVLLFTEDTDVRLIAACEAAGVKVSRSRSAKAKE